MAVLAFSFFILAILLFWLARRQRQALGLPGGRIIRADTRSWNAVEKPLYAAELGLTGKPDYLVEQRGQLIPIEVKTGRLIEKPYDSHIYQLAAYCVLVTSVFHQRPAYGILHYTDGQHTRTFAIDFTSALEQAVLDTIAEIQSLPLRQGVDRSHDSSPRCRRCGYRQDCDQSLRS
jgi:CRISPR-associated exonuclease Cas4